MNESYEQALEAADLDQKRIDFLTDRKSRYRKWQEELAITEELFRDLCMQLDVIVTHTQKIWFNTCKANDAVKILFCMVRKFFLEVDYLKCRYDELWGCVTRSSDLSLKEDKGIISCLKSYKEKLDVVIKARDEIVKQMVDAVKYAQLLRNNMNTACCLPDNYYDNCNEPEPGRKVVLCDNKPDTQGYDIVYGFKAIICEWYYSFGCNTDCMTTLPKPQRPSSNEENDEPFDPCKEDCELFPQFKLPVCNDYYKQCIINWLNDDDRELKDLLKNIAKLNKNKEGLLACKGSLIKAIEETNPKLRCK